MEVLGWIDWSWRNYVLHKFHNDPTCNGCKETIKRQAKYYLGKEVKLINLEKSTKKFTPFGVYCERCHQQSMDRGDLDSAANAIQNKPSISIDIISS